jgi:hypothetical protein
VRSFISCDPLGCRRRRRRRCQRIDQRLVFFFFALGFSSTDFEFTATVEIKGVKEGKEKLRNFFSILFFLIEFINIKKIKYEWSFLKRYFAIQSNLSFRNQFIPLVC